MKLDGTLVQGVVMRMLREWPATLLLGLVGCAGCGGSRGGTIGGEPLDLLLATDLADRATIAAAASGDGYLVAYAGKGPNGRAIIRGVVVSGGKEISAPFTIGGPSVNFGGTLVDEEQSQPSVTPLGSLDLVAWTADGFLDVQPRVPAGAFAAALVDPARAIAGAATTVVSVAAILSCQMGIAPPPVAIVLSGRGAIVYGEAIGCIPYVGPPLATGVAVAPLAASPNELSLNVGDASTYGMADWTVSARVSPVGAASSGDTALLSWWQQMPPSFPQDPLDPALVERSIVAALFDGHSFSKTHVSAAVGPPSQPAVAFGAGGYLIAWATSAAASSDVATEIWATRYRVGVGAIDHEPEIRLSGGSAAIDSVRAVAVNDDEFLVAWVERSSSGEFGLRATKVSADGSLSKATLTGGGRTGRALASSELALATNGAESLLAYLAVDDAGAIALRAFVDPPPAAGGVQARLEARQPRHGDRGGSS